MPGTADKGSIDGHPAPTIDISLLDYGGGAAVTNLPAAVTAFGSTFRWRKLDLRPFREFRVVTNMLSAGFAGSKFGMQYSLDGGTNWKALDTGTASAQSTAAAAIDNTTTTNSAWGTINGEARIDDCLVRPATSGGDGIVDPSIIRAGLQLR